MPRVILVRLPGLRWRRWCAFTLNDRNEQGPPCLARSADIAQMKAATGPLP